MRDGVLPVMQVASLAAVLSMGVFHTPAMAQDRGEWELILTIMQPGVAPVTRLYGIMVSEAACEFAGQGMAQVILAAAPLAVVGVTCRLSVSA